MIDHMLPARVFESLDHMLPARVFESYVPATVTGELFGRTSSGE